MKFLEQNREAIVDLWTRRVAAHEKTDVDDKSGRPFLRDHISQLLSWLELAISRQRSECDDGKKTFAEMADSCEAKARWEVRSFPVSDLPDVLREFSQLRRAIVELWREQGTELSPNEIEVFHAALDEMMATAANLAANEAATGKDEFLGTLAHELRTSLTVIIGYLELLSKIEPGSERYWEMVRTIERSAATMARAVDDLLDISRMIRGKFVLRVGACDIPSIMTSAFESARAMAEKKGIVFDLQVDSDCGPFLCDPGRVVQVLSNLLSNSIKFTPAGGTIRLRAGCNEDRVEFEVKDTGAGIEPRELTHLFKPFQRGQGDKFHKSGLGLGLAICRRIVELHGGSITAESEGRGKGSTFRFFLRLLRPAATSGITAAENTIEKNMDEVLKGLQILVVDDSTDARAVICDLLRECGADVVSMASAAEALEWLKENRPRVILCDIYMPDINGYEFLRRFRRNGLDAVGVPVIAVTAYTRSEDPVTTGIAGFHGHLSKPFRIRDLIAVLNKAGVIEMDRPRPEPELR